MSRLRNHDDQAWEELIEQWGARLYAYLRRNVPTSQDAEDLLSETFTAAVQSLSNFDGQVEISTWLYAIARHKIADFWRRHRPTNELDELVAVELVSDNLDLEEALARLPEVSRQALLLRYREGMGVDEVAVVLGRTYKATESLLSRSRAQLRALLGDRGGYDD